PGYSDDRITTAIAHRHDATGSSSSEPQLKGFPTMTVLARKITSAAEISARFSGSTGTDQSLLRRNGTGKVLEDALPTVSDAGRLTANRVAKPSVSATFATLLTLDGRDGDRRHVIL